jgi:hypothetical protein
MMPMATLSPCQCFQAPAFSRRNQFRPRPTGVTNGTLTLNPDGTFTYNPNTHYVGPDSFTYTWSDGLTTGNTATVAIDVYNNAPYAYDGSFSVLHDRELTGSVYGYDPDGDPITAQLVSGPTNGTLTFHPDGTFTYTPNTHYVGPDSFTYTWSDGLTTSETTTVTIDVYNDSPYANDDRFMVLHDRVLTAQLYGFDPDGDPITAELVSGPSNGTVTLNPDGTFTFVPAQDFVGPDGFVYLWSDGITETVRNVVVDVYNMPPFGMPDFYTTTPGQELRVYPLDWLQNDLDLDGDMINLVHVGAPTHGQWQPQRDGSYIYVPESGFTGLDELEYTISDGVATATAKVIFELRDGLLAARDDTYTVAFGETLHVSSLGLLANDRYPTGTMPQIHVTSSPHHGHLDLSSDGAFSYTPDEDFAGEDEFSYVLTLGEDQSQPAKVRINVVRITVEGPRWVPINANNDHGSDWAVNLSNKYFIPKRRDFESLARLPAGREDPELMPLTVRLQGVSTTLPGFISVSVQQISNATGRIRLWTDRQKSRWAEGIFPLAGPNALPSTIYVEGTSLTSRTIVNNAIQPEPNPDNTIRVTYYTLVPAAPGQLVMPVPIAAAEVPVGVGPVVQFFTINNSPIPPNPEVPERFDGRVVFINGKDISDGFRTERVNAQGRREEAAVVFDAQVFRGNIQDGQIRFIQNLVVQNGAGAARPNAFTFNGNVDFRPVGGPFIAMKSKRLLFEDAGKPLNRPVLDMILNQQPPPPWYESHAIPGNPAYLQIHTQDTPGFTMFDMVEKLGVFSELLKLPRELQLPGLAQAITRLDNIDFDVMFKMFLVWETRAGSGPINAPAPADARGIYSLAVRPWQWTVRLDKAPGSLIINRLNNSAVSYPEDFLLPAEDPIIQGPTANLSMRAR